MKRFGIHIRLLFAAVMLITATTVTLGYMGLTVTRQFALSRFENRMNSLAQYLALNCELRVLLGQKNALEELGQNLLSEDDVVKVSIEDEKGNSLAEAEKSMDSDNPGAIYEVSAPVTL